MLENTQISRRDFIKSTTALSASLPMISSAGSQQLPTPTPAQLTWQQCEIGLVYHFDLPIAARRFAPNNTVKERLNPKLYNPTKLDTDQWLEAAKAAGAKYAIFTATHFNGFMQWQSDLYPYGLKQAAWKNGKGDVVDDFVNSCHKAGILPGIYFSTHRNVYWEVWGHYVNWGQGRETAPQKKFNRIAEKMTEELCSHYGPLLQIWYDAGVKTPEQGGPDVLPIFEKYQPDSVFYHNQDRADFRWIGNEQGYADYPCWSSMPGGAVSHNAPSWKPILGSGDPNGTVWSPGMVDVPIRNSNGVHNWFWHPDQDHAAYTAKKLLDIYYTSVGRNCNLVIGEVITPEGLVPESDIERLAEFGDKINDHFSNPIAQKKVNGNHIILDLPKNQTVHNIILQEDIKYGERVRAYKIYDSNSQLVCEGESVGHKRIHKIKGNSFSRLCLDITKSVAKPHITFSAF